MIPLLRSLGKRDKMNKNLKRACMAPTPSQRIAAARAVQAELDKRDERLRRVLDLQEATMLRLRTITDQLKALGVEQLVISEDDKPLEVPGEGEVPQ